MYTVIGSEISIDNPTSEIVQYCKANLILDNPDYLTALKYSKNQFRARFIPHKLFLYRKVGFSIILPFGCLRDIWPMISKGKWKLAFPKFIKANIAGIENASSPRDYQEKAIQGMMKAKGGLLIAPAGSGKTNMLLEIIRRIGGRALFMESTRELLKQSEDRFRSLYSGDIGEITGGKVSIGKDITFATVQTLVKVDPREYQNEFTTVVVDEAAHAAGSPTKAMMIYKVLSNLNCRYKFGATADLHRADGLERAVTATLGNISYEVTPEEVGKSIIRSEQVMFPLNTPESYDYLDADGKINFSLLIKYLSFSDERNKQILDKIAEQKKAGRHILVLTALVSHSELLGKLLNASGIKAIVLNGNSSNAVRKEVLDNYLSYDCVVATFSIAKEGLDMPKLDCEFLVTPVKDEAVIIQSVGRVERNYEGKRKPVVFDCVDENIGYCLGAYTKRRRCLANR